MTLAPAPPRTERRYRSLGPPDAASLWARLAVGPGELVGSIRPVMGGRAEWRPWRDPPAAISWASLVDQDGRELSSCPIHQPFVVRPGMNIILEVPPEALADAASA